ncbi:hypothetical protein HYQ44_004960 [Verticillium longisporum]|nr:hypothetical protein HYQ44_004960 [Verticillium longisporum]
MSSGPGPRQTKSQHRLGPHSPQNSEPIPPPDSPTDKSYAVAMQKSARNMAWQAWMARKVVGTGSLARAG